MPKRLGAGSVAGALAALALMQGLVACRSPQPTAVIPEPAAIGAEPVFIEAPTLSQPELCEARTPRGAMGMMPASLPWLMSASPYELMRSQLWTLIEPPIAAEPELQAIVDAFEGCGLPLGEIQAVTLGFDESSGPNELALLLNSPGAGEPSFAACLMTKLELGGGQLVTASADSSVQVHQTEEARGYLFNPDVLMIVQGPLDAEILALSRCEGPPAISSSFAPILSELDTSAPVWLANRLLPELSDELSANLGLEAGSMLELGFSLRFSQGVSVEGAINMNSVESAQTAASSLASMKSILDATAPPELQAASARIVFESREATMLFRASLTPQELEQVSKLMQP